MPINNQGFPVYELPEDCILVKYIDLSKFLSLLQRSQFFFCRADKFEDKLEGYSSRANKQYRFEWEKRTYPIKSPEEIEKSISMYENFEEKLRKITCINCWNMYTSESSALWKIYANNGCGIMIITTKKKLISAFSKSEENILLSKVNYVNKISDISPDGNTIYPFINKHLSYIYEDEVRLIYELDCNNWEYNWDNSEDENGKYIDVSIKDLLQEVIVGPETPKYIYNSIEQLLREYKINDRLKWSEMKL
jgi:hypothetical protein